MPSVKIKRAEANDRLAHQRRLKEGKTAKLAKAAQSATPAQVEQQADN
jgi:hypothetical protein